MPDGDIVHSRLRRLYQKPYKWLCEGKATSDECARVMMQALKQDIVNKGNLPVKLAQSMGEIVDEAINAADDNGSVDWAVLSMKCDNLVQQFDGRPDLKELTTRAAKSLINDLKYEAKVDVDNASVEIFTRYMNEVYESEFKERTPLTSEHYAGIDQATLSERIEKIQLNINAAISEWAKAAINHQSIETLRLPCRFSQKPVDLNEDLLAG